MILSALFFYGSYFASAADIVNVDFPCPTGLGLGDCPPATDIPGYLNNLYKFAVGIAGLLALGMIVAGGVYYTISAGSGDKQKEAKSMITSALLGVALLMGTYLILNTINPQITKLGELASNVDSAPSLPTSTPAEVNVQSDCGDFAQIQASGQGFGSSGANCATRKRLVTNEVTLADQAYYDTTIFLGLGANDIKIKSGSVVWLYPYYIPVSRNKACLVYAFREPNTSTTRTVTLKDNLRLCAPHEQNVSGLPCSVWRFEALSSVSPDGPWAPVQIDVGVSQAFNYPNQTSPPPALQRGGSVIPNSQVCYNAYCKNQKWSCVQETSSVTANYTAANYFPPPSGTLSNDEAVARLRAAGISVSSSGNCSDPLKSNCTSLQGIPGNAVQALVYVKNNCRGSSGNSCEIIITGGTEIGHQTHGPGKSVVDLRFNPDLAKYLKDNLSQGNVVCTTAQNSQYRIGCGGYNETENHLHIQFG